MLYWWDRIKDLDIPKPKTIMIDCKWTNDDFFSSFDGEPSERAKAVAEEVKAAALKIGYPVFLRTDLSSEKHSWRNTCYVSKPDEMQDHIGYIMDSSLSKDLFTSGFAVREFLKLESTFSAFAGMPIAKERRFFVKDDEVLCHHAYWPPASIYNPSIKTWKIKLNALQNQSLAEIEILSRQAVKIGKCLGGFWSVDFCFGSARDKPDEKTWFVIDLALGDQSYHWCSCDKAPPEMMKVYGDPEVIPKPKRIDDWF